MKHQSLIGIAIAFAVSISSCNNGDKTAPEAKASAPKGIKEENVAYTADGATMDGFVAYDSSSNEKRPVVLIVHEWWGLNDYPKMRARQLADLGYLAMAIDMYGNGKTAENPKDAGRWLILL
jgi:hypothetical protein